MIRVNLLPIKRKKKAKAVPTFLIYMTLLTAVTIIASAYLFWYLNSQISALKKQKAANEAQIEELKVKIKDVANYESQKKTLEQRTKIIEELKKNQSLPVKIFTELNNVIPDGVWLQSLSISGLDINMSGSGFTNDDVVNYVDNLKKSQLFTDVNLLGTQKSASGKVVTYQFTLKCKVKET